MTRKNNTLQQPATDDQMAKLARLREARNKLVFEAYISPLGMLAGWSGSQLFNSNMKWMNGHGFAPAPLADPGKTRDQILAARIFSLAGLKNRQKEAFEALSEFSNQLSVNRTVLKILLKQDLLDPLDVIDMHVIGIRRLFSKIPEKILEEIKANYSLITLTLAAFSHDIVFREYFTERHWHFPISLRQMMNQGPLVEKLQKKDLITIVTLLRRAIYDLRNSTLLNDTNWQNAVNETPEMSALLALGGAFLLTILLMASVALTYMLEHVIYFGYKKWNGKSITSSDQVQKEISTLEALIPTLQLHASRVKTVRYAFLAIASLIALYNAREQGPESFAIYFLILNNTLNLFSMGTRFSCKKMSDWMRQRKIHNITLEFNRAVACTGVSFEFVERETFALSHLKFSPISDGILSPAMINQIVKNVLLNNGIHIASYEKNHFTVKLVSLSKNNINLINQKIAAEIERYKMIKQIGQRIKQVLKTDYKKHILSDDSGLPTVVYEIPLSNPSINLDSIRDIFSGCEIEQNGSILFIKGHRLSNQDYQGPAVSLSASEDYDPNASLVTKASSHKRKKQTRHVEQKSENKTEHKEPEASERIEFPCGAVYDSSDPHCEIKRVNHPVFGKNHFVLFRIPEEAFASPADCKAVRNKIYEAEFAASAKGSQGLQFRRETGRDLTAPHERLFSSEMRSKHLGVKLGDLRPVAETERSLQNKDKQLHVFKGLNTH